MLKNHFKIAWRNFIKNRAHSFINIVGLTVGMTVAILIGLWIWDEHSFDKYYGNYDRIARVMQNQTFNMEIRTDKAICYPLATELRQAYGNYFSHVVLSSWTNAHTLSFNTKQILKRGNFMEPDAAAMLSLKMSRGTSASLGDPSSILISASLSTIIFGDADPIGKVLRMDNNLNAKVTGVYDDFPYNTSFRDVLFIANWDLYASSEPWIKDAMGDWNNNSFQLFVQTSGNEDISAISAKIKNTKRDKLGKEGANLKPEILLFPMSRWHLYSEFTNGSNTGGRIQYVWMFGTVGIFVLLLACINFMNLSTARSEKRAKEVGIRKAIGSLRSQLIVQFFTESFLIVAFSFIFSVALSALILPYFNELADKRVTILWTNPLFWLAGLVFSILTGLIAGSYPALYLSSFRAIKVLKGTFKVGPIAAIPRKVLVVLQFTVSVVLIIGTMIVYRQIQFAKNRPIGYTRNGLVMVRTYTDDLHNHFGSFRNDLLQSGFITEVAESAGQITQGSRSSGGFEWKGKELNSTDDFMTFGVSPEYGKTVGWQFTAGRDFSKDLRSDSSGLVLNESAVKYMKLKKPIGETITWDKRYTVIGVIKDMVMSSPYEPSKQTIFFINPGAGGIMNIKINPQANVRESLNKIESTSKKYSPSDPFDYKFVDEEYSAKFSEEERLGNLATFFAILAIFISGLGLFGLASFVAEQRTKEIGVRKVLGASVFTLWRLLTRDFIILSLVSMLIGVPTAYYLMYNWLKNYQYRTEMPWWIFALAGLGALLITLLTVSYQSIRAALMNPSKSLRTE